MFLRFRPYWVVAWARLLYYLGGLEAVCALLMRERLHASLILQAFGATLGEGAVITGPLVIHNAVGNFQHLQVGCRTHIGRNCFIDLSDRVIIGDYAVLSMNTTLLTHQSVGGRPHHPILRDKKAPVVLEEMAYMGAGSILLAGCRVGRMGVVAAGSVVTRDVPPGTVVGGVSAVPLSAEPEIEHSR